MRSEPVVSDPIPTAAKLAAIAAAGPPLDPPGYRLGSYGFLVSPKREPTFSGPLAHSNIFAVARRIAPAAWRLCHWKASSPGIHPFNRMEPAVAGKTIVS